MSIEKEIEDFKVSIKVLDNRITRLTLLMEQSFDRLEEMMDKLTKSTYLVPSTCENTVISKKEVFSFEKEIEKLKKENSNLRDENTAYIECNQVLRGEIKRLVSEGI